MKHVKKMIRANKNVFKVIGITLSIQFLLSENGYAIQGADGKAIMGLDAIWGTVKPYITGAFSAGGVIYSGINIRKVVIGDYRAAVPALVSALVAGLGIQGMFGAEALSVLLP